MTPRFQVFFLTRLPFRRTKSLGQLGFQPCILGSYISLYIYVYIYTHIRCKVHQPNSSTRHVPRACNHSLVRFISSRILLLWPSCRFPKHQIECWRCEEECNDTPCDHQSPSVLIHTPRNGIHTGIHVGAFLTDSKNVRKMFEKKKSPFSSFSAFSACFPKILHSNDFPKKIASNHLATPWSLGKLPRFPTNQRTETRGFLFGIFHCHLHQTCFWQVRKLSLVSVLVGLWRFFVAQSFEKVRSCGSNV